MMRFVCEWRIGLFCPPVHLAAAHSQEVWESTPIAPDLAPGAGVDRPRRIGVSRDVHHAVRHDRRRLESTSPRCHLGLEDPAWRQPGDVLWGDRSQRTMALFL